MASAHSLARLAETSNLDCPVAGAPGWWRQAQPNYQPSLAVSQSGFSTIFCNFSVARREAGVMVEA
jgi:hypothetical protein